MVPSRGPWGGGGPEDRHAPSQRHGPPRSAAPVNGARPVPSWLDAALAAGAAALGVASIALGDADKSPLYFLLSYLLWRLSR